VKLDRLLGITFYMLHHRRATAAGLAERFEVSRRTIYRDIESLAQAGLPFYTQKGTDGGIFLMEGYRMDSGTLTKTEIKEILALLQGAQHMLAPAEIKVAADKLSILADQGGPVQIAMNFSAMPWQANTAIQRSWQVIRHAIETQHTVSFTYINSRGQRSRRQVEPMTLVLRALNWYLYGFCRGKEDYRLFRLSRMIDTVEDPTPFSRRDKEWQDNFFLEDMLMSPTEPVRLLIDPPAAHKAMDLFCPEELTLLPDGSLQVDIRWPVGDSFDAMVLSFGPYARVVSPDWVRDHIRDVLEKIQTYY
jgi:predicted DNA-binding transcriptional regulator YafY